LRPFANDLKDPADDPQREQALLAIFDRDWHRSDRHAPVWTRVAAAGLVFAAALMWHLAGPPRSPRTGTPPIAAGAPETKQAQALDAASLITPDSRERPAPGPSTPPSTPVHSPGARHADLRLDEAPDSTEFVAWPGATAWPPFESGELIRIDIPTEVGAVQAEVLVGQDGFPRAIRLVQ
jgi:hypothetical protein